MRALLDDRGKPWEPEGDSPRQAEAAQGTLRICLAGSGPGHVRQLLDLEPAWAKYDFFFLTEETALPGRFGSRIRHAGRYAGDRARSTPPARRLLRAANNAFAWLGIMLKEKPDAIIATGAGAMVLGALWGRLLGAKVVTIESVARFDEPPRLIRWTTPLAQVKIVPSAALAPFAPGALVFDPLKTVHGPRPPKRSLLFAAAGAALPFHRLVKAVEVLKRRGDIPEDVFIQTGVGGYQPEAAGVETAETLSADDVQRLLREADIVVCPGEVGVLLAALGQGCRVAAMPRLAALGEAGDDHQADIARAFAQRDLISWATTVEELAEALRAARSRPARLVTADPQDLIDYLDETLAAWAADRATRARR